MTSYIIRCDECQTCSFDFSVDRIAVRWFCFVCKEKREIFLRNEIASDDWEIVLEKERRRDINVYPKPCVLIYPDVISPRISKGVCE